MQVLGSAGPAMHTLRRSSAVSLPSSSRLIAARPLGLGASRRASDARQRSLAVRPRAVGASPPARAPLERDPVKEERLKKFRVVYDFEKWANHRSTGRYLRHFGGMLTSRVVYNLRMPLATIGALATLTCVYMQAFNDGLLPSYLPSILIKAPIAFNLSSFALSLLLVFRTNASYGRFDEARKFWGGVVNRSRDISRQAVTYIDPVSDRAMLDAFIRWQASFPWVMKNHLREEKTWDEDLKNILLPEEIEAVKTSPHPPNMVLMMLSQIIRRSDTNELQKFRMDENLMFFADMLGACERLLRTPIPVSYTRHTSRFLMVYLFFMPFTIYSACPLNGWGTIPASMIISFLLLAVEEIGVCIEEPFYILPLEAIANTISTNVQQHLDTLEGVEYLAEKIPTATTKKHSSNGKVAADAVLS